MRRSTVRPTWSPRPSPPDRHGYFSLGRHAEYVAAFIGEVPFFVEVNPQMPRTFGEQPAPRQPTSSAGARPTTRWSRPRRASRTETRPHDRRARRRAHPRRRHAAGRHRRGPRRGARACSATTASWACTPSCSATASSTSSSGASSPAPARRRTATRSSPRRRSGTRGSTTSSPTTPGVEFWPVDYTNDPREHRPRAADDARSTRRSRSTSSASARRSRWAADYWSSSGGQPDFARGAVMSEQGQSFIVLHSTTARRHGLADRAAAAPGRRGHHVQEHRRPRRHRVRRRRAARRSDRASARARLIAIAHPKFRDELTAQARALGYL